MKETLKRWGIETEHLLVLLILVVVTAGVVGALGGADEDGEFANLKVNDYFRIDAWEGYGNGSFEAWFNGEGGKGARSNTLIVEKGNVFLRNGLEVAGDILGRRYLELASFGGNYGDGKGQIWYNGNGTYNMVPGNSWVFRQGKISVRDNKVQVLGDKPHVELHERDTPFKGRVRVQDGDLDLLVDSGEGYEEALSVVDDGDKVVVRGDLEVEGEAPGGSGGSSDGMQPPCEGGWTNVTTSGGDTVGYFWKCN